MAIQLPIFNTDAINLGFIHIKWYSLAYVVGIIIAMQMFKYINKKYELKLFKEENKSKFFDDFLFYGVIGIVLGGRIGYVLFYNFDYYLNNLSDIFSIWKGGMSFHGGFIGTAIAGILLCKKYKIKKILFADVLSVISPIALLLGRIANFINLELYGKQTNVPWAMIFPYSDGLPRHPSQLYEAFLEGVCLFSIMIMINKIYKFKKSGLNISIFLIFYGLSRLFVEIFREPDIQLGYFFRYFTMGQILSIPFIFIGIFILYKKQIITNKI